ncbi:MAG: MMPL family transporter, partial [Acidimicrobiales bacterium]|nr:MMPL family transporter [Acidimicrobiales bacterium]
MFQRLGPWMHDHKWWVIAAWVLVLVSANGVASSLGDAYGEGGDLPDIEAKEGFDLLDTVSGGADTGQSGQIVFRAPAGVADAAVQATMEDLFVAVEENDLVVDVVSPYEPEGAFQVSAAGDIAFAEVKFDPDMEFADAAKVRDLVTDLVDDHPEAFEDVQVELGGAILAEYEEPSSEILGLAFAIVILIVAFGSVLAMGLPIGVALFGIGIGSASIMLISNVMTVPEFAPFLGAMIGLGVGIDYALLIVTRYREQLHAGHDVRESVGIAIDTAGRSVLFAGATVVISLLGMVLMGVSFVQGLAVAASTVVAVTVLASLTLLPALLALAGGRVELTRWRGLIAAGLVALGLVGAGLKVSPLMVGFPLAIVVLVAGLFLSPLKRELPRRPPKPRRETMAYRWSRIVQHRPWTVAIAAAAVLLVLAVPVLSLRLGFSDESNFAPETTTRKAYDLIEEGFGAGYSGKLLLVADVSDAADQATLAGITEAVAADEGVAFVSPPQIAEGATIATWVALPTTGPQDEATSDLVRRLRDDVLPTAEAEAGVEVFVTGPVAINVDFSALLASRLPWFFGAVLVLSFLLLMAVFRSLLVPLKAVIMNLLSIGAAYGIAVALFQWGWL